MAPSPLPRLPRRLHYLRPVLDQLAAVPPDELHEDNDAAAWLVDAAVQQRVAGLSGRRAEQRLESDLLALRKWLSASGGEEPAAHFAFGYLMGMAGAPAALLAGGAPLAAPAASGILFDPPEGLEAVDAPGALMVRGGGLFASLYRVEPGRVLPLGELVQSGPESLREKLIAEGTPAREAEKIVHDTSEQLQLLDVTIQPLDAGDVTGLKYRYTPKVPIGTGTIIHYALQVPRGHVHVTLNLLSGSEHAFEARLHTLRVA